MAEPEKKWRISPGKGLLLALLLAVALLAALGKFTRPDRTGDYPAAIMVDGTGYLVSVNPLPAGTVDKAEITGCVDSYTGTFPEKDGQQNFSREAALPYAPAEGGLALLHDGAWYLCVPAQVDDDGVLLPGRRPPLSVPGRTTQSLLDFSHANYIIGTVPPRHHPPEGMRKRRHLI